MTAEEIIEQYGPMREYDSYFHEGQIVKMMEQYAKQRAMEFLSLAEKEGWIIHTVAMTTEELYNHLFINDTKQRSWNMNI